MSKFLNSPVLRVLSPDEVRALGSDVALYQLAQDFFYMSDSLGTISVPAGLVTDFASIPRFLWRVISPEDPVILYPSIVHDFIYSCLGRMPDGKTVTRKQADALLVEAMAVCGAGLFFCKVVHFAVSKFGASHWKV